MLDLQLGAWPIVTLGDVVERHQEICRDVARDGLTRFVKVEHMDTERLTIDRWGNCDQEDMPPTFYNVFRKGHVLFPSRNPHLRRVTWPQFDGICGEKTFVLKAIDGFHNEFLPFLMRSDVLIQHAVRMKIGSTNPHVRWRDLASFQFSLPPIETQRRVAAALCAVEAQFETLRSLVRQLERLRIAALNDFFKGHSATRKPLREVASVSAGGTPSRTRESYWSGNLPWASAKDMKSRDLAITEEGLSREGWEVAKIAPKGATLIVVRGMILAHTFPVARCVVPVAFNQDLRALIPGEDLIPDYLTLWAEWAGPWFLSRVGESSHGTKRLEGDVIENAFIPITRITTQSQLVKSQNEMLSALNTARERLRKSQELKSGFFDSMVESQR